MVSRPKLAMCNFIPDAVAVRDIARSNGFQGVDWTLNIEDLPRNSIEEAGLIREIERLQPLEVRYHCAFRGVDLGEEDIHRADAALDVYRDACRIVSKLDGRFMTIHLGLGRTAMAELSWERTLKRLSDLVDFARDKGIHLCLENLASGWTSRPELFEKLIRKSGAGVTFDIGHAQACHSVESCRYEISDFVSPHPEKVHNAHVYCEERDDRHLPPSNLGDMRERLEILDSLPCDWWVLELRDEESLLTTLETVNDFLDSRVAAPAGLGPGVVF